MFFYFLKFLAVKKTDTLIVLFFVAKFLLKLVCSVQHFVAQSADQE